MFGPIAIGIFNPSSWSADPGYLTFQITRVIIAVQVLFTGIALPKAYLLKEWRSLIVLLGPVMTAAWFMCGLLIWALIPGLTFLESLVIGSCVTPTDPVLANSICKGESVFASSGPFAEHSKADLPKKMCKSRYEILSWQKRAPMTVSVSPFST